MDYPIKYILILFLLVFSTESFSQGRDIRIDSAFFRIPGHENGGIWVKGSSFEEITQSTIFPVKTLDDYSTLSQLRGLTFSDYNTGWASGTGGTILRTTDGGVTWYDVSHGDREYFDIFNINGVMYACGIGGQIIKSLNGFNFISQNSGTTGLTFFRLDFPTSKIGWVVGEAPNQVMNTTNGGLEWNVISTGLTARFRSVFFLNAATGWVGAETGGAGVERVRKTTDGGGTWTSSSGATIPIIDLFFLNENTGWAVSTLSRLLKTTDGGTTWEQYHTWGTESQNSIVFVNEDTGWISGHTGLLIKSTNGGLNWFAQESGVGENVYKLIPINQDTLYASGTDANILKTIDGGNNWHMVFGDTNYTSMKFLNVNTGFVAGGQGTILKTTNGGNNWISINSPTRMNIYDMFLLDEQNIFICGLNGNIFRTTNGGISWVKQESSSEEILKKIIFINGNTGYAVGNGNAVVKTTNSGTNWFAQTISAPATTEYNSISFLNANTGWISALFNQTFKTTDGGDTWVSATISSPIPSGLSIIDFLDENTGWVTGQAVLRTTNAGSNWELKIDIPTDFPGWNMSRGFFLNQNTGYVSLRNSNTRNNTLIIKTTNGGSSWDAITPFPASNYLGNWVFFGDTGYAVGRGRLFIKTTDGGNTWVERKIK